MAEYTWEIDTLPVSTDKDREAIIAVLNQREIDDWDLAQTVQIDGKVMFFWRSKQ